MLGALDLGTNNCRLLVVKPEGKSYHLVESFSRSVRLGEGLVPNGVLSHDAMERAIQALIECAKRLRQYPIHNIRLVATEACRMAKNRDEFLNRVYQRTGLRLEIISQAEEAELAVKACIPLLDRDYKKALVFDIGGGSMEMAWLDLKSVTYKKGGYWEPRILSWFSLPLGVVTLSSRFTKGHNIEDAYKTIVQETKEMIAPFIEMNAINNPLLSQGKGLHLLGTSGTVTTLAALSLSLRRYSRFAVDGLWLEPDKLKDLVSQIKQFPTIHEQAQSYVGTERIDLILPGCALLEALLSFFDKIPLRVADRGIREGLIYSMLFQEKTTKSLPRYQKMLSLHGMVKPVGF